MTYDEIITEVSSELKLPRTLVDKTYKAYWKTIREHIGSQPLKQDLSDEEFLKLRPNVNIPSIGKLTVTQDRYKRMKKSQEYKNKIKEDNAAYNKDKTNL